MLKHILLCFTNLDTMKSCLVQVLQRKKVEHRRLQRMNWAYFTKASKCILETITFSNSELTLVSCVVGTVYIYSSIMF